MEILGIGIILLLLCIGIFYFLPTIIALLIGCDNKLLVLFINLFFGWTFIGWIIAFLLSLKTPKQQKIIIYNNVSNLLEKKD